MDPNSAPQPLGPPLEELEQKHFLVPDSIMDPQIFKNMKSYIKNGGQINTVIDCLSSSYRGYTQMTSLIYSWMQSPLIGLSTEQIDKMIIEHLKSVIIKYFDSKKADEIFASKAPKWLEYMITHAEWRNLIYQLSENFPQCALLNFAIQQICESGNYLNEIVSVATSASSYRVFHRVLTDTITNMMQMDEQSFQTTLQDFKKICCFSQYTYMYAQALLATLAMNAHDLKQVSSQENFFLRLMEELEEYILKQEEKNQNEAWIRKLRYLFMEQNLYLHQMIPSTEDATTNEDSLKLFDITFTIITVLLSHSSTPGDVNKLYKFFSKNQHLIILLQHPHVLDILISDIFDPSKKEMDSNYLQKYIHVLSLATISSPILLEPTSQALQHCISMCSNKASSTITLIKTITQVRSSIGYNIVCVGLLYWMGILFSHSDYFISTYQVQNTKLLMALLQEMALYHPSLHYKILDCVVQWYDVRANSATKNNTTNNNNLDQLEKNDTEVLDPLVEIEIKKQFLHTLIYLICIGYSIPTLKRMQQLITDSQMDYSLIRYFLHTLWEQVSQESMSKEMQLEMNHLLATPRAQLAMAEK